MHDAKGRELKVGDTVLIPARVKQTMATEDYCTWHLETLYGRRLDGQKEMISRINMGLVLRANHGDENSDEDLRPPVNK